ncbi:MAG: hypothetical protein JWL79_1046 [Frankiales bacterium]|nr:hypothetical protein [Frankiales bacterium]
MSLLMDPPHEAEWAEQAGAMTLPQTDQTWRPGPLEEPCFETSHWLAELEDSLRVPLACPACDDVGWAVPGVFGDPPPRPPRPAPSADLQSLTRLVARLAEADPVELAPEQALSDLEALLEADQRLRVARLARLTDAHIRKLAALEDEPSIQTWARHRFDDVPRDDISAAGTLRPYVHLRGQVQARLVGVEAGKLVARALQKLRPHVDRPDGLIDGQPGAEVVPAVVGNLVPLVAGARLGLRDDDPLLIDLLGQVQDINGSADTDLGRLERAFALMGQHIPLRHLKAALEQQLDAVLPVALEEKAERARRARNLRLDKDRETGGAVTIRADDELYELLETVLAAEVRRDPENPADTGGKREVRERDLHGERLEQGDVEADEDVRFPRTRGQRLHDAMRLVLQRYLAAGLAGTHDKAPVSLTVTVPLEILENRPGSLPAIGGTGRRLPASLVRRWWCDAQVTALVLSQGLIPLGITHTMRTLTATERRASRVQHGEACSGLRCCAANDPLVSLVPHHVRSFAKFGKTSIEETIWACDRLHDAIHRGKTVPLRSGRWINEHGWADEPPVVDY